MLGESSGGPLPQIWKLSGVGGRRQLFTGHMTCGYLAHLQSAFCSKTLSGQGWRNCRSERLSAKLKSHNNPSGLSRRLCPRRWLQPQTWLGLLDSWGLPATQPNRGKARGNEYQPSNIKRKHKHGWIKRLSTPAGVQVILRRMLKGRKSLSH